MELKDVLHKDLVFLDVDIESDEEAFEFVGKKALELGLVEDTFAASLVEREREFPTGLLVGETGVTISHTDPEHIVEEFVSLVRPNNPVTFKLIDQPDQDVAVELIFVLGLKKAVNQLECLKAIMALLEDKEKLKEMLESKDLSSLF